MNYGKYVIVVALVILDNLVEIETHGMVMEPVSRSSAHRKGFKTPANYDDNANFCGGYLVQYVDNDGNCGVCGDDYADEQPRANENGGTYGTGTIVQNYTEGQEIEVEVKITASHWGTFEFAICPIEEIGDIETEECFEQYPLKFADGSDKWILESGEADDYKMNLVLPEGLVCEHCSFRWHWRVANSFGWCEDGIERMGCGNQETFRTCSDIRILPAVIPS